MESVELKEKVKDKRIRRSFPRHEVYHRWIHSPEYCYTNSSYRYKVSGFEDWLIAGDFSKDYTENATRETVINEWVYWRKTSCVAVINRDKKQILISLKYLKQSNELLRSIPNDYEVFKTEEEIPRADILSTGGLSDVLHLHANYLIEKFIERYCYQFYTLLAGKTRNCNESYYDVFSIDQNNVYNNSFTDIINFVKKYKVKKYDWYKEASTKKVTIYIYKGWSRDWIKVNLPSLKQVVTKKIFKPAEIDIINKKSFYTKYCYGRGISYKLVEQNWNKPIDKISFEDLCSKFKHPISWDDIKVKPATWNDGVKVIYNSIVYHYKIIDEINKKKSEEYYQEALAKVKQINESSNLVNNWREGKHIKNKTVEYQYWRDNTIVEYQSWIKSYKEGIPGHWITSSIYIKDITFSNTQLRLTNNRQTVNTSKYANVSLEDAIKMWKFYIAITKDRVGIEGQPIMIRLEDRHYNVGIYNLRAIQYNQKKTDDGKLLDKWEWCVVIGCHYIWIDDFMDFIKYYNLYSIFDIKVPEEENKEQVKLNKPFKIKIK